MALRTRLPSPRRQWSDERIDGVAAWFGVVLGGVVFYLSVRIVSKANAGRRLPYRRNPQVISGAAMGMRVVGVFLVALSASFLVPTIGYWSVAVVAAALAQGLIGIPIHNRRLSASS